MRKAALLLAGLGCSVMASAQLNNPGLNMVTGHTTTQTVNPGVGYNGWTNTGGATIEFVPNTVWQTHEGTGAVDLNGTQGPGAISQLFSTTAGQAYRIDFWYSGNPGPSQNTFGTKSFNVLWNGGLVGSFTFTHQAGDTWANMRWLSGNVVVLATSSTGTLTFQGTNTNHPEAGAAIDDVSVTAVPEPTTIVALGLGACALLRRRKK